MKRLLLLALGSLIVSSYLFAGNIMPVNPFVTTDKNYYTTKIQIQ